MDLEGQQLHPNWRSLATVHIPIKRFVKEGAREEEQGTHEKYKILGVNGEEIKDFYTELVTKEQPQCSRYIVKERKNMLMKETANKQQTFKSKNKFEVKNYFRFAMENKVEDLRNMDVTRENMNICDSYGWTALMMASCEGAYEAVEYLLTLGVDKHLKDKTGKTAKDIAEKKGYFKVVELLQKDLSNDIIQEESYGKEINIIEPFYCEICQQEFTQTSLNHHQTSTIHQFNMRSSLPANKLQKFNIPPRNKGLQLMVKQGWDKESGLGPSQTGRLYPVKTVIRKQRTGLGIEQEAARVTHFEAYDRRAIQRHNSDYYKKKPRNRNDIKREKVREWKRDRRLRNELN
ncbi:G patch domain and ankyrin repeat-containing protein 1 homolog [Cochliomyia hominivorax]